MLSVVVALLGGFLASRMAVQADLLNLLPSSKPSVRDLVVVQQRARPFGTVEIVIESKDPARRALAGAALSTRLARLADGRPDLITLSSPDDGPLDRYAWQHRFLLADLADLTAIRDGLDARIERARLAANPLYVALDDDPPDDTRRQELLTRLADLEAKATAPPPRASADGTLQLIAVQTAFGASSPGKARQLIRLIRTAIREVRAELVATGPGAPVEFGLTGNVTAAMREHDSVLTGMTMSALIAVVLCGFGLLLYYRSGKLVLAMLWSLSVGVAATFALAWALIGHLNVMTAFLTAIVIGNGINPGLILVARYLEEVRAGRPPRDALAPTIAGALRGTLAATGTAAVAYGALLVTDFRGFRQFGAIAGIGMALTWTTAFTVLPAILCVLARRGHIRATPAPAVGTLLARIIPHRRRGMIATMIVATAVTLIAGVIAGRYIINDPFTHDWRDLQSSTAAIRSGQRLTQRVRAALDEQGMLAGQAYAVVIAVDRRDQVGPLVERLRVVDAALPPEQRWVQDVHSIEDLLPAAQPEKLAVLAEIRARIDDPELQAALDDGQRAELARLRPPDDLRAIGDADVPRELAWPFIEKDGSIGRLIVLRGARRLDSFNVNDRLAFAANVRALERPPGAVMASESLVVADIIETMEHDAPSMIGFALLGSIAFVLIGVRGQSLITLACGMAGVTVMVAVCALVGIKVHFLDLIALPITIGIGIDYAVNLAARDREDGQLGPRHLVSTTGAAVLLCSYTTSVGYGTLLLSANGGIRAFGEAALIGELSCILMALVVAPALLALRRGTPAPA